MLAGALQIFADVRIEASQRNIALSVRSFDKNCLIAETRNIAFSGIFIVYGEQPHSRLLIYTVRLIG